MYRALGSTPSCSCMELTQNNIKALRTSYYVDHHRLQTWPPEWCTCETDPNNTAKALKIEVVKPQSNDCRSERMAWINPQNKHWLKDFNATPWIIVCKTFRNNPKVLNIWRTRKVSTTLKKNQPQDGLNVKTYQTKTFKCYCPAPRSKREHSQNEWKNKNYGSTEKYKKEPLRWWGNGSCLVGIEFWFCKMKRDLKIGCIRWIYLTLLKWLRW